MAAVQDISAAHMVFAYSATLDVTGGPITASDTTPAVVAGSHTAAVVIVAATLHNLVLSGVPLAALGRTLTWNRLVLHATCKQTAL